MRRWKGVVLKAEHNQSYAPLATVYRVEYVTLTSTSMRANDGRPQLSCMAHHNVIRGTYVPLHCGNDITEGVRVMDDATSPSSFGFGLKD